MPSNLSSPEQLNDYLKVTNPKIWMLLVAVILLVVGLVVWGSVAAVESYATGTAQARAGELTVTFDNADRAQQVKAGMAMEVGGVETEVLSVGTSEDGSIVASARASIPDGAYEARVGYRTTQVITLLFN